MEGRQLSQVLNLDAVLISQSTVVTSSPWGATVAKNNIAFCNVPWLSASWTPGDLMKYHEAISACEKGGEWLPVLQLLQQMMDEHVERCKWCMVWCKDENYWKLIELYGSEIQIVSKWSQMDAYLCTIWRFSVAFLRTSMISGGLIAFSVQEPTSYMLPKPLRRLISTMSSDSWV